MPAETNPAPRVYRTHGAGNFFMGSVGWLQNEVYLTLAI